MSERRKFEKWYIDYQVNTDTKPNCWQAWQAARESEPAWTNRLNTCPHHGDDHEACAVYGGRVPCDAEGGEAVAWVSECPGSSVLFFEEDRARRYAETHKGEATALGYMYSAKEQGGEAAPVAWAITDDPNKVRPLSAFYAFKNNAERHIRGYEKEFQLHAVPLYRHPKPDPQPDKWIPCSERLQSIIGNMECAAYNLCSDMNRIEARKSRVVESTCPEASLLIAIRDLKELVDAPPEQESE